MGRLLTWVLLFAMVGVQIYTANLQLAAFHTTTIEEEIDSEIVSRPFNLTSHDNTMHSKKPACALLFFGLPRLFKMIPLPSILKYIVATNPTCDIYAHSYNVTSIANEKEKDIPIKISELRLLTPNIVLDTEQEFLEQRNQTLHEYYKHFPHHFGNWYFPTSMDNMVKQWHSLERVWDLMLQVDQNYTQVGLFRSDVFYTNPIDIFDGDAVIPQFASYPVNDRMFYGKFEYAEIWATHRFRNVPGYLGRAATGQLKTYARDTLHSEFFMRDGILHAMPVKVQRKDICFFRVRGTGDVLTNDCNSCDDVNGTGNTGDCDSAKDKDWSSELNRITGPKVFCWSSKCFSTNGKIRITGRMALCLDSLCYSPSESIIIVSVWLFLVFLWFKLIYKCSRLFYAAC